jgi:hypothetical protein
MNRLLIILTLIVLTSCAQSTNSDKPEQAVELTEAQTEIKTTKAKQNTKQEEITEYVNCPKFDFNSVEQQADSLLAFKEKATDSTLTNQIKWEQKFFCAFPNSFKGMQALFGFHYNGAAPLYHHPVGYEVIKYFSRIKSIPDSIFYDKYVRINIGGVWEADNIGYAFYFDDHLLANTKEACKALSKFSDKEVKSVFRFIYDNPHPQRKYFQENFEKLKNNIAQYDKRLSELLTESYENLMSEDHSH